MIESSPLNRVVRFAPEPDTNGKDGGVRGDPALRRGEEA